MKEMKAILKKLQRKEYRIREPSENEKECFSCLSFFQRYFPAMDSLSIEHPLSEYSTLYSIHEWNSKKETTATLLDAIRKNHQTQQLEPCRVFVKTVHLLNPIDCIKGKYGSPSHPFLPQPSSSWKTTVSKLHSRYNQAYVDAFANFILSQFREQDLLPHFVLYYGSSNGIIDQYRYNLSGEYDTYRNYKWFWKGMKRSNARLTLANTDDSIQDHTRYHEFYKEITSCPYSTDELEEETDSDEDDSSISSTENSIELPDEPIDLTDIVSVSSIESLEEEIKEEIEELQEIQSVSSLSSVSESESDEDSDEDSMYLDMDIYLTIPNVPVMMILQEAQEGVMDDLMMEEEIDGHEHGSQAWEARWIAWLFQVIATLTFLQQTIQFTHNDLHSNNILWRSTEKRFLYYRNKEGNIWRVPTFGKIFSIIDFGRAIFRIGKTQWISDDHWPDQDAGDQYNFGPFYDSSKPKILPNPSFDLCRLAVSMIDGLFDEYPETKKGKKVPILSEEGSWKMYETKSPLFNLLWSWTVDDAGRTIYETEKGEEKYDGFDLYIRIAQDVHQAVPKEQLHRSLFHPFLWKEKIPKNEKVYSLQI